MLKERDRKLLFILATIAVILCLAVCIPFGLKQVTLFEIIFKYLAVGLYIVVLTAVALSMKYRDYRPTMKYTNVVTYTPVLSFTAAVLFNTLSIMIRNNGVFSGVKTNVLVIVIAVMFVALVIGAHVLFKAVILFDKNEVMLTDGIICVLAIVYTIVAASIAAKYRAAGPLAGGNFLFILIPLLVGAVTAALVVFSIKYLLMNESEYDVKARQEMIDQWLEQHQDEQDVYAAARLDLLESMHDYTGQELMADEADPEEVAKLKQEVADLKETLEQSKAIVVEGLKAASNNDAEVMLDALEESLVLIKGERKALEESRQRLEEENNAEMAEIQAKIDAYEAAIAAEEAERLAKEAAAKEAAERRAREAAEREANKQPIEPSFEEFKACADQIGADRDDIDVQTNDKQTFFRYRSHKHAFLSLQQSNNDYRISFFATNEEMRDLLYSYNGVVSFDKSQAYDESGAQLQQLKLVYRGDGAIDAEKVKELMAKSLDNLLAAEQAEEDAIQARKDAEARAKLAEQALREKEALEAKQAAEKAKAEEEAKAEPEEVVEAPAEEAEEAKEE